jgi:flavodoxin
MQNHSLISGEEYSMSNVLVVFYSRKGENHMPGGIQVLEKGHTAYAAEYIQKALNADLFEIDTVVPYAENYRQCCGQAVAEAKANARPDIQGYVENMEQYDTVFVCFPCWCGTAPMCVFTFLEHYDLTGKTVIPLCTNEGSGLAKAPADLAASCPGAVIAEGLSVRGHQVKDSEDLIATWAKNSL